VLVVLLLERPWGIPRMPLSLKPGEETVPTMVVTEDDIVTEVVETSDLAPWQISHSTDSTEFSKVHSEHCHLFWGDISALLDSLWFWLLPDESLLQQTRLKSKI